MKTDFLLRNRFLPIHIVVFVTLYMVLGFLGFLHQVPGNQNLILWDSAWYNSVRLSGYWFDPAAQSNSGFFPLFPYFWRVLGVGVFQISLINAAIALFSFGLIANTFRFETDESLLYLSLPGMFFLYIPYTESLFYLFSAMMLIGLYKKNNLLIMVGIFLSSLVRPTSFFFLPAIIFMEIINAGLGQNAWKKAIWNMMIYSFVTLAAFFLVVLIQWYQTGVWFAYIKAQTMFWGHAIHWPKFPLVTWEGARLLWLDGTAFLFCLAPLPWCIWLLAKVFSKKTRESFAVPSRSIIFSAVALVMTGIFILLSNPYAGKEGTSLLSLNRYVYATPFLVLMLWHYQRSPQFRTWAILLIILATVAAWLFLFLGDLPYLKTYKLPAMKEIVYFTMMTLYFTGYVLLNREKWRKELRISYYWLNMVLQLAMFDTFLSAVWVG